MTSHDVIMKVLSSVEETLRYMRYTHEMWLRQGELTILAQTLTRLSERNDLPILKSKPSPLPSSPYVFPSSSALRGTCLFFTTILCFYSSALPCAQND